MGALLPHFVRRTAMRRGSWVMYLAVACLFLVIVRYWTFAPNELGNLLPPTLQPPAWITPPETLRPGEFIDTSRIRRVPDVGGEPPASEPDGRATLHDQRDEWFWKGGLKTLTSEDYDVSPGPVVFDPYPAYNSEEWRARWKGEFRACEGPRGIDLDRNNYEDMVLAYRGNQKDFPYPMFGSHEALGLDANVCMDRCSRLGAYGHAEKGCRTPPPVDWEQVNWGVLQEKCADRNSNRYKTTRDTLMPAFPSPKPAKRSVVSDDYSSTSTSTSSQPSESESSTSTGLAYYPRSAVLIRTWHEMKWTENHRHYLRSLVMELALHSGAEYHVYLIVDVKDEKYHLSDPKDVKELKHKFIPREFHDMVIFFDERSLAEWYPGIEEHTAIMQHLQPVQIFSQLHPNFDYVWQFEMDARNTGHAYHFLDRIIEFGRQQPRKYLWERNAYYYTPGAHGSWEDFTQMVDKSLVGREDKTVWYPPVAEDIDIKPVGPKPPVASPKDDKYEWGVGEEADLMTLLPIFEARNTTWTFPDRIWNVPKTLPRRASPITMWRLSKNLLNIMHEEGLKTHAVVSEMSGPTWAMLYGLKGVYVPHPMYVDGKWSAKEVAKIYNPGEPELINGDEKSIWSWNHEMDRIMYRISYMFTTQLAEDLWRRFLGYPADPKQYNDGRNHKDAWGLLWYEGGEALDEVKNGRLCFPPIFMHTVKNTEPVKGNDQAVPV